jgi:hypothetical protein
MKSLKYIGNYSHWINPEWVRYMLENDGVPRPCNKESENDFENHIFNKFKNAGYDLTTEWSCFFEKNDLPFDIEMPVENAVLWWFIKQKPGQYSPLHVDQEEEETTTVARYWMSMLDYQPGHLLICNNELAIDYKAGDMFMFTDPDLLHGSSNIGFSTRLALNITQRIIK